MKGVVPALCLKKDVSTHLQLIVAQFRPRWPDLIFSENPGLQNFMWTLLIFKCSLLTNN